MPRRTTDTYPPLTARARVGLAVGCAFLLGVSKFQSQPSLAGERATPAAFQAAAQAVSSQPFRPQPDSDANTFQRLSASEIGIDFVHRWTPEPKYEEIIDRSFAGGGVAIGT